MEKTKEGKQFLFFDTGPDPRYHIICFCIEACLLKLLKANQWFADATFKSSPCLFRQLWTIHAQFNDRTLTRAYFLMTGSTQGTYEDALIRFKVELDQMLPIHYREFLQKKRRL